MKTLIRKILFWALGADVNQLMLDNKHLRDKIDEMAKLIDAESGVREDAIESVERALSDIDSRVDELESKTDDLSHDLDRHDHESIDDRLEELEDSLLTNLKSVNEALKAHQDWIREMTNKELSRGK